MWIGSLRVRVLTKSAATASTDSPVIAALMRDNVAIYAFFLNPEVRLVGPPTFEIEKGTDRNFFQYSLPKNSENSGSEVAVDAPPGHPPYGLEYDNGLLGHCTLKLRIFGNNLWITDEVELYIRELHPVHIPNTLDAFTWVEEANWKSVARWSTDIRISSDTAEGVAIANLNVR